MAYEYKMVEQEHEPQQTNRLAGSARKYLRGLGHNLDPVVQIGRQGLSDTVVAELEQALDVHELIKVRFHLDRDQKREMIEEIARRLRADAVGAIGHTALFYRPAEDPEKRRISLPG